MTYEIKIKLCSTEGTSLVLFEANTKQHINIPALTEHPGNNQARTGGDKQKTFKTLLCSFC